LSNETGPPLAAGGSPLTPGGPRRPGGPAASTLSGTDRRVGAVTTIGTFHFTAPLWRHRGADGWHFVSVPLEISDDIRDLTAGIRRGFGSVRVAATVGRTTWRTSVFPSSREGTFMLPVKAAVRTGEGLQAGDEVRLHLVLVDL